jgi:hypothetical protein
MRTHKLFEELVGLNSLPVMLVVPLLEILLEFVACYPAVSVLVQIVKVA